MVTYVSGRRTFVDMLTAKTPYDIAIFLFVVFQKICKILNWTKGGDEYSKAEETLTLIWEGLKKYADENQVSLHN